MHKAYQRPWIGLLGGTFDPIHYGHLNPAIEAKQTLKLDQIWLMPNAIPPHKADNITDTSHRLSMIKAVCEQYSDFTVCDIELQLAASGKPNYSVNTLEILTKRYPDYDFIFLMGMDSLMSIESWYQWQQLPLLCNLLVSARPGWQAKLDTIPKRLRERIVTEIQQNNTGQIQLLDVSPQAISSTEIRQQIRIGNLPTAMLPTSVADYIRRHNLYL